MISLFCIIWLFNIAHNPSKRIAIDNYLPIDYPSGLTIEPLITEYMSSWPIEIPISIFFIDDYCILCNVCENSDCFKFNKSVEGYNDCKYTEKGENLTSTSSINQLVY